jgi:hypothetical protein
LTFIFFRRNRIALLQKEEDRARKKTEQTKERALEILVMRTENEKRVQTYVEATDKNSEHKRALQSKAKESECEMRRQRADQLETIQCKRRQEVVEMQHERKEMSKVMVMDQLNNLKMKQKIREEVRKKEEDARIRREKEKRDHDLRVKQAFEQKAAAEEADAKKAEKLVRSLERREREWMIKLRDTQIVQEIAFEQLESALLGDTQVYSPSAYGSGTISRGKSEDDLHFSEFSTPTSSATKHEIEQMQGFERRDVTKGVPLCEISIPAGVNIPRAVSSPAGGSLPRVGPAQQRKSEIWTELAQPRGRINSLLGVQESSSSSGPRSASSRDSRKKSAAKSKGK